MQLIAIMVAFINQLQNGHFSADLYRYPLDPLFRRCVPPLCLGPLESPTPPRQLRTAGDTVLQPRIHAGMRPVDSGAGNRQYAVCFQFDCTDTQES
ncbi:hypothetical protein FGO68_gene11436 [Halteria grandinella]|uniref:Uncharacterized protein n=1 Tax=Halteria grandinella TaxID=5974 RepID=A0A8J8NZI3_HALGN|nr:hypothetical protein FGO68_gene11436 [Halteria grandinella]